MDDIIKKRIMEDPDYINMPKAGNSLKRAIEMFPDGMEMASIAKALCMTEDEVNDIYESAIEKLRMNLSEE